MKEVNKKTKKLSQKQKEKKIKITPKKDFKETLDAFLKVDNSEIKK